MIYSITLPTTSKYLLRFNRHFISNDGRVVSVLAGSSVDISTTLLIYTYDSDGSYKLRFSRNISETNFRIDSQVLVSSDKMLIGGFVTASSGPFRL